MGRGQGRPQRLYSGVERRPAISMKSKKKFMILWVLLIAVLFAGSLLTAPPGKTETIQTAMRDAVLHEENQISLFGWKNVNPGLISAMTVSAILLIAAALKSLLKYPAVEAILSGVRPCVVAMILATAITMALSTLGGFQSLAGGFAPDGRSVLVFVLLWVVPLFYKKKTQKAPSPIGMILLSAVLGAVLWSI